MKPPISVGILLFDGVEVLDFAGPYEVFTKAGKDQTPRPFEVKTVAPVTPVRARDGLSVNPDFLLEQAPPFSILIVPGGPGARREMATEKQMAWLRQRASEAELLLSVCTGALLLAKAQLVKGLELTTHHSAMEELRALAPHEKILQGRRFIDNGKVILSAGVTSGIDMSLHVVGRILGQAVAQETAQNIEYQSKIRETPP
jgi:transcriptional regulator GlxA family with amidase domain